MENETHWLVVLLVLCTRQWYYKGEIGNLSLKYKLLYNVEKYEREKEIMARNSSAFFT